MRLHRAALLAAGVVLWASPAAGQTRFEWPDTGVDVSAYGTADECFAAMLRARQTVSNFDLRAGGAWRDTTSFEPKEVLEPLPAPVVETTRRCLRRFAVADSVSLEDFGVLLPLYLIAGWDDRAGALAKRRLAAIAPDAEKERAAVLDTVVSVYLASKEPWADVVKPPRIGPAYAIASAHAPSVSDRVRRFHIYVQFLMALEHLGEEWKDTAAQRQLVTTMVGIADSLTDAERDRLAEEEPLFGGNVARQLYGIYNMFLGKAVALDSLRRSTAAYVRLMRENWARATGHPPETFRWGMPIGEQAPPIEAGIWLGRGDDASPRPRRGRISIVVLLDKPDCRRHVDEGENTLLAAEHCAEGLVALRRLKERFPMLDITVEVQTHGHFLYVKDGITPEREAELSKRWLESFGVDAPLAVAVTDFWRLPAPDGRRIDPEDVNVAHYKFGQSWPLVHTSVFLVDPDGIIVHAADLTRYNARDFVELIEVLVERGRAGV